MVGPEERLADRILPEKLHANEPEVVLAQSSVGELTVDLPFDRHAQLLQRRSRNEAIDRARVDEKQLLPGSFAARDGANFDGDARLAHESYLARPYRSQPVEHQHETDRAVVHDAA